MDKLDFRALVAAFKNIFDDYDTIIADDNCVIIRKWLLFCVNMICRIGPEADALKRSPRQHLFKVQFDAKGKRAVYLSTDLSNDAENKIRTTNDGMHLIVTPRQGNLLAVNGLYRLIEIVMKKQANANWDLFMTPLAANIFCPSGLSAIAVILNVEPHIALMILNESCLSGSYFLKHSNVNVAVVAVMESTKLHDVAVQSEIVMKCLAEYAHRGQQIDIVTVSRLSPYAHGGLTRNMRVDMLFDANDKYSSTSSTIAEKILEGLISQYVNGNKSYETLFTIFKTSKEVSLIGNDIPPSADDFESALV